MIDTNIFFESCQQSILFHHFIKDRTGAYLFLSESLLQRIKLKETNIIGASDFDLSWNEYAPTYRLNDTEVMQTNKEKKFVDTIELVDGSIVTVISSKIALHDKKGNCIGLRGNSIILEDIFPSTSPLNADKEGQLTTRQKQCLYYLVVGMTIKQIAKQLQLSPRTVEHYLESIKVKLDCDSKEQLVTKGLQLPFIKRKIFLNDNLHNSFSSIG